MLLDAITGGSTIQVTVGELFAIAGAIGSILAAIVGVYQAGLARDRKSEARHDDMERWQEHEWAGGPQARGGYKQKVDSLRKDQTKARGVQEDRDRRDTGRQRHPRSDTRDPGHDTQT